MAIDLDYMVKLKDRQVIEREMVRGELRDVIYSLVVHTIHSYLELRFKNGRK